MVAMLSIRSTIVILHSMQRLVSNALIRAVSEAAPNSASVLDKAMYFCSTLR